MLEATTVRPAPAGLRPRRAPGPLLALFLTIGSVAACGPGPATRSGEWPRFRGPAGDGLYEGAAAPERWSEGSPNILWKTRIPGTGNSSPIVHRQRVYVTTAYGEASDDSGSIQKRKDLERVVMALELPTGKVLWETPLYRGAKGAIHWTNTHAVPTPATDGRRLYVSFDSRLAALDLDGRILWQKDFDPDYVAHSRYGASASVALSREAVILARDREDADRDHPGFLVAVDKKTGAEIWRHEWTDTCCSYTTPLVVERGGREEVLHSGSKKIVSYEVETGAPLWSAEHPLIQPVPSLLLAGNLLISPGAPHLKAITLFRLTGTGADTRAEQLWSKRGEVPDIPSPILYLGKLFTVTEKGVMVAWDVEKGRRVWRARLPAGNYHGSPVATAGRIYLPTLQGLTAVVSARSSDFQLLAENQLPDGSGASPALTTTCLLLRTASHLYCIGEDREAGE